MKLGEFKPGDILEEDIHNFQGLLLLKKHTVLTDKNIRMLKSWGISEAPLQRVMLRKNQTGGKSLTDIRVGDRIQKIKERFGDVSSSPVMKRIMETSIDIMVKNENEK